MGQQQQDASITIKQDNWAMAKGSRLVGGSPDLQLYHHQARHAVLVSLPL